MELETYAMVIGMKVNEKIKTVFNFLWLILFVSVYIVMAISNTMLPISAYVLFYLSTVRDFLV